MENYATITEALAGLKARGYTLDFNAGFDGVKAGQAHFSLAADKFKITEVYRFEGETDPDDEAVVYAIESTDGIKGTLVNGYGISTDPVSDEMIQALLIRHESSRS